MDRRKGFEGNVTHIRKSDGRTKNEFDTRPRKGKSTNEISAKESLRAASAEEKNESETKNGRHDVNFP